MSTMTLMVDRTARPVSLTPMNDAVARLAKEIASGENSWQSLIVDESRRFRSQTLDLPAPLVVMFDSYVELTPREKSTVTKRVMFARDNWSCQYCGMKATPGSAYKQLTIDHVKPQRLFPSKAAATTWENVVSACAECNGRKGGKLPMEAVGFNGKLMLPKTTPKQPHFVQLLFAGRNLDPRVRDYIAEWYRLDPERVPF